MAVEDHTKVRPWRMIDRRKSRQIHVGNVAVGGDAPISVQSMTNTPTSDANATINQIRQLEDAGADILTSFQRENAKNVGKFPLGWGLRLSSPLALWVRKAYITAETRR